LNRGHIKAEEKPATEQEGDPKTFSFTCVSCGAANSVTEADYRTSPETGETGDDDEDSDDDDSTDDDDELDSSAKSKLVAKILAKKRSR
jgi:hypothetical protein